MSAAPQGSYTLPAEQRIKQSREFSRIKLNGRRFSLGCLVLNWHLSPAGLLPRLGVVVSRKVGNAVVRNRVKRYMRESFRLHQAELPKTLELVLVARPSIARKPFAEVERDLLAALKQTRITP